MQLLQGEAFDNLFREFRETAFHLEVQDSYQTPDETGPFELFLRGESDDFAWHQPWLNLVRSASRAGKQITRARVVSVPHGDYTRWGLAVARHNIEAGEAIRYLPRHLIDPTELTTDDWWLFDDDHVVFTVFQPGGQFAGGASTTDPAIVRRCRSVRDTVWEAAIEHADYLKSEYAGV